MSLARCRLSDDTLRICPTTRFEGAKPQLAWEEGRGALLFGIELQCIQRFSEAGIRSARLSKVCDRAASASPFQTTRERERGGEKEAHKKLPTTSEGMLNTSRLTVKEKVQLSIASGMTSSLDLLRLFLA